MGPEAKLYQKLKRDWNEFSFNRLENSSLLGTPDVLVYNNNRHFFTIELKVTKGKKVRFSPHQIAFHYKHPTNTFIIVEALGPRALNTYSMYKGSQIRSLKLAAWSLKLTAWGLTLVIWNLPSLELDAWNLDLLSLALVAYSFFFSEYWSMGSNRRSGILGPSTVALAPAAAVLKKIH
jgi:hypothetical protein